MAFMNSITAVGCMVVQFFVNSYGVVFLNIKELKRDEVVLKPYLIKQIHNLQGGGNRFSSALPFLRRYDIMLP